MDTTINTRFATFTPLTLTLDVSPNQINSYYTKNGITPNNSYLKRYLQNSQLTFNDPTPVSSTSNETMASLSPTTSNLGPVSPDTRASAALKFFIDKGLSKAQAAGIVGNLQAESQLDPTAIGDRNLSTPSEGMAQWRQERLRDLKQYADSQNKSYKDWYVQLGFVWNELNTSQNAALRALLKTKTPQEAAKVFSDLYERPKAYSSQRERNAVQIFNTINV